MADRGILVWPSYAYLTYIMPTLCKIIVRTRQNCLWPFGGFRLSLTKRIELLLNYNAISLAIAFMWVKNADAHVRLGYELHTRVLVVVVVEYNGGAKVDSEKRADCLVTKPRHKLSRSVQSVQDFDSIVASTLENFLPANSSNWNPRTRFNIYSQDSRVRAEPAPHHSSTRTWAVSLIALM
ncbi:hypothetical protein F4776DRAFT_51879 [Hypoxylon sp. NC0597]|nr:hypothetical protein F4776DRAFT_51879 [Hypoxylon sp. NC0597]